MNTTTQPEISTQQKPKSRTLLRLEKAPETVCAVCPNAIWQSLMVRSKPGARVYCTLMSALVDDLPKPARERIVRQKKVGDAVTDGRRTLPRSRCIQPPLRFDNVASVPHERQSQPPIIPAPLPPVGREARKGRVGHVTQPHRVLEDFFARRSRDPRMGDPRFLYSHPAQSRWY